MKVLIYHTARWCVPCKQLKPQAKKIAEELGAVWQECNVDEQAPLIPQILGVPTIAIFDSSKGAAGDPLVILGPQQATPANIRKWLA